MPQRNTPQQPAGRFSLWHFFSCARINKLRRNAVESDFLEEEHMKPRMILPMLPVLLAMIMLASSKKAEAFEVGVSVGGGHYYHNGAVVEYRTTDPAYATWYPDSTTSYVYAPTVYDDAYVSTPYVYSTDSVGFGGWYGGGRSGRGGNYGGGRGGGGGRRR